MSRIPVFLEEKRDELERLCLQFGVRKLEVFGSATSGRFDPASSDLDFLVEIEPAPPVIMADHYFGLLEALEALFGRSIDLVMAKAIKNPYFLQGIEAGRTLLYAA